MRSMYAGARLECRACLGDSRCIYQSDDEHVRGDVAVSWRNGAPMFDLLSAARHLWNRRGGAVTGSQRRRGDRFAYSQLDTESTPARRIPNPIFFGSHTGASVAMHTAAAAATSASAVPGGSGSGSAGVGAATAGKT
jgi:hypothetical protein